MDWGGVNLEFPEELRGKPLEMGIDEAGRGPVLGPMVYGCAFSECDYAWPPSVNDSKQLTADQRESILDEMKALPIGFGVKCLSAVEISAKMLARAPTNLNQMSHDAARMLVQAALDEGLSIRRMYVDTVGPEERYQEKLEFFFPSIRITVSKKADSKFKSVGAASINAKVLRDRMVREFAFEENWTTEPSREFGSGYPGDPTTVKWLDGVFDPVFGFPSIVRFSWSSIDQLFKKNKAMAVFDLEFIRPRDSTFYAGRFIRSVNL
jgi:ribonuclease H2 subunit A